jgi:hypothetical protein
VYSTASETKLSPQLWTKKVCFWFRILYVIDIKHCMKTSLKKDKNERKRKKRARLV